MILKLSLCLIPVFFVVFAGYIIPQADAADPWQAEIENKQLQYVSGDFLEIKLSSLSQERITVTITLPNYNAYAKYTTVFFLDSFEEKTKSFIVTDRMPLGEHTFTIEAAGKESSFEYLVGASDTGHH